MWILEIQEDGLCEDLYSGCASCWPRLDLMDSRKYLSEEAQYHKIMCRSHRKTACGFMLSTF